VGMARCWFCSGEAICGRPIESLRLLKKGLPGTLPNRDIIIIIKGTSRESKGRPSRTVGFAKRAVPRVKREGGF